MPVEERFTLESESVGALPVVNWFLARMGVFERPDRFVPHDDARLRLAPAAVIGVALRNIVVGHRPVYALGEWAAPIDAGLLGLLPSEAAALNDDRVGRMLDRLFDADRATLITETVLSVVREFHVELEQLHNDSTTVTLTGTAYPGGGEERGGKAVAKPAFGHNKDFRPDLLTELRDIFSLVRGSPVVRGWVMVPAHGHCQRRRTPGSRFVDGAVGGIGGPDRGPLRALSAA